MLTPEFVRIVAAKLAIVLFEALGGSCVGVEQARDGHVDIEVNRK